MRFPMTLTAWVFISSHTAALRDPLPPPPPPRCQLATLCVSAKVIILSSSGDEEGQCALVFTICSKYLPRVHQDHHATPPHHVPQEPRHVCTTIPPTPSPTTAGTPITAPCHPTMPCKHTSGMCNDMHRALRYKLNAGSSFAAAAKKRNVMTGFGGSTKRFDYRVISSVGGPM